MTAETTPYRELIALACASILIGCTSTNTQSTFDQSLIQVKNTKESKITSTEESLSFRINGEKVFFGRPSSIFGGVFKIRLDLKDMQEKCAENTFGERADFSSTERNMKMHSEIKNFSWAVQNAGLFGQNAAVSFNLSVDVTRGQTTIYSNQTSVKDYILDEAEFESHQELFLSPVVTAFTGKADKFALAAFMATTKHLCEEYQKASNSLSP